MEPETRKPLLFQTRGGIVEVLDDGRKAAFIAPEAFTQGWAKHAVEGRPEGGLFDGLIPLPDGGRIGVKCFVDACPESQRAGFSGFRVRYVLTPTAPVQILHLRVVVNLPYGDWAGVPYRLGSASGLVPADPPADIRIAGADSTPLTLGPAPALEGLTFRLEAPGLRTVLQDNRQWTPYLQAFVTRNEPADAPWPWRAGEERFYEFSIRLGFEGT